MKTLKYRNVISALVVVSLCSFSHAQVKNTGTPPGFALVELFTSEGCSSCPAADEVVKKLAKENIAAPVYVLGFHVDYWDRLGWRDIYSSADYSRRQREYASRLRLSSVYTPQVVINGQVELVGSDEKRLRALLTKTLETSGSGFLSVVKSQGSSRPEFQYKFDGEKENAYLLVAVVQKMAVSNIRSGENEGKIVSHINIVRTFASHRMASGGTGSLELKVPDGFNNKGWEIIMFVQNVKSGRVLAATRI